MPYFIYGLLFILGILIGSFLNVVSLRYKPGQDILDQNIIGGRSYCLVCHSKLSWYELVPLLSFILQKGECRRCGAPLLIQYPLVELLSGFIFLGVPWYFRHFQFFPTYNKFCATSGCLTAIFSAIWILIFLSFLLLAIIDFWQSVIPDQINVFLAIIGSVFVALMSFYSQFDSVSSYFLRSYAFIFGLRNNIWLNHLFAALVGMAILGAIIILSRGRAMGWGDFKLVGAIGLIFGWPETIIILALSFIIGALFSVFLLVKKMKNVKDAIAFGPFLVVASTLVFFWGYGIMNAYFKLFNL